MLYVICEEGGYVVAVQEPSACQVNISLSVGKKKVCFIARAFKMFGGRCWGMGFCGSWEASLASRAADRYFSRRAAGPAFEEAFQGRQGRRTTVPREASLFGSAKLHWAQDHLGRRGCRGKASWVLPQQWKCRQDVVGHWHRLVTSAHVSRDKMESVTDVIY